MAIFTTLESPSQHHLRKERDYLYFNRNILSKNVHFRPLWIEQGYALARALNHGKTPLKLRLE